MANVNIRNLPDNVHAALRIRAAQAGRSMEAEVRAVLAEACLPHAGGMTPEDLMSWVDSCYQQRKPLGVVENLIAERRREAARE
ncbi:MAG: hypothetical protein L0H83_11915 [Salinisphaera sp.]|nr:hypothetical protein [Salinisphaera sp.]